MELIDIVLIALAVITGGLYFVRRNSRKKRDTRDKF